MARGFRADPDAAGDNRRTPLVDMAGPDFPRPELAARRGENRAPPDVKRKPTNCKYYSALGDNRRERRAG